MSANPNGPSVTPEYVEEETIDLRQYWQALLRRKWIISSLFLAAVVAAVIASELTVPIYEASATVMIKQDQASGQFALFEALGTQGKNTNQNYLEVLKSWSLAERAWEKLGNGKAGESADFPAFKGSISLQLVTGTDAIRIKAQNADPAEAKRIVNAVVDAFIESNQEVNSEEARSGRTFIEQQLRIVESDLRKAEDELQKYKEQTKVVAPSEEASAVLERLTELAKAKADNSVALTEVQRRISELQKKLKSVSPTQLSTTTVSSNPVVIQYKMRLSDLESQLAVARSQYGNSHPKIDSINTEIAAVRQQLSKEVERVVSSETTAINPNYQSLLQQIVGLEVDNVANQARRDAVQKQISIVEADLASLPQKEAQLTRLLRNQNAAEQVYLLLKNKREEYRIAEAVESSGISVVDYARASNNPIRPKKKQNVAIAGFLGLFVGVGLALLLEFLDTSLKNSEDVERYLALPVMGSIPLVGAKKKRDLGISERDLISQFDPKSPVVEAFRTLRTNLQYAGASGDVRKVMVTSAGPSEGKSTISANLGYVLAQSGKRVVIVGCDLRKPTVHRFFKLSNKNGLTSILAGQASLGDCLMRVEGVENLYVLPGGPVPPNPAELLGSERMTSVIHELSANADMVIFDAPPVIAVTDAAVLATKMDGVLVVANAGTLPRELAVRAKDQLEKVGARILGVILNRVSVKDGYGYYYYYYYSQDTKQSDDVN